MPPLSLKAAAFAIMRKWADIDVSWDGEAAKVKRGNRSRVTSDISELWDGAQRLAALGGRISPSPARMTHIQKAIDLLDQGYSHPTVADELGITQDALYQRIRQFGRQNKSTVFHHSAFRDFRGEIRRMSKDNAIEHLLDVITYFQALSLGREEDADLTTLECRVWRCLNTHRGFTFSKPALFHAMYWDRPPGDELPSATMVNNVIHHLRIKRPGKIETVPSGGWRCVIST